MSSASGSPPQLSGPGILQTFVSIPQSSQLAEDTLLQFLDNVYTPALIETGVVESVRRYKAANPAYDKQHMIVYNVPDLAPLLAGKLQKVPRTSETFPTNGPVEDFVEFESRIFSLAQVYQTVEHPEDATTTIIYAAMETQPGGEADLEAWYQEEHNQQMSEQPGWKRTVRYSLLTQYRPDGKDAQRMSFLAIHEFGEGHKLGQDVAPLDPITDWTKKCMSEAKAIDAAIYEKVKVFGKVAGS
ncbi:hypothetical protein BU24DRAFT_424860 [Aaosphaeria arxii CBS 175.79]|uniref:EthD domain-containing protein n=1 Tax=Aaosphaeria arxii CBS 175.79 TaxID=1450172 RepID=A0A6A5XLX3_9PLEO|nr:uncharacterized protein BU24DRAFT_424860 [Aaosphaeria arxii CBS 175.79]KAF2013827.1 hypothetical protein BU24DRAFT_424860 [Aaosphaeria arxii CBS 175.79]